MNNMQDMAVKSVFHIEDLKIGNCEGVLEVSSFSPTEIALKITTGSMEIRGENLEVKSFDVDNRTLHFTGEITSISLKQDKPSFLKRLTK